MEATKTTLHEKCDQILECDNAVPWGFNAISVSRMKWDGRKSVTSTSFYLTVLLV